MGAGMAQRLLGGGFALHVHARRPAVLQAWVARGAQAAGSPAELARRCEAVVLCVSDAAAVGEILFGPEGLMQGAGPLRHVVDTSTIGAAQARDCADRLAARGIAFLDAPVSGGPQGAAEGTLVCMVGGDGQAFGACRPLLAAFSRRVEHVGPSGAGQVCKACNQIGVLANLLGVAEIVSLCRRSGLDPQRVRSVLLDGSAASRALQEHALRLIEGEFHARFRADLMLKDVRLVRALEESVGVQDRVTGAAEPLLARLVDAGMGDLDWTAIGRLLEEDALSPPACGAAAR